MVKHILLIAADRHEALRIQELFYGAQVELADSTGCGLSIAQHRPPDAIVIAGEFPEVDGATLCRLLNTAPETAHIPTMLLTRQDGDPAALLKPLAAFNALTSRVAALTQRLASLLRP
jgi:CheY-like chemotaxis protein